MKTLKKNGNAQEKILTSRFILALCVLFASFAGVGYFSNVLIEQNDKEVSLQVFNTILPLVGTWVGTVLAFYFSRENFESASRSMREMADKLTPLEKLRAIPVEPVMIPKRDITLFSLKAEGKLEDVLLIGDLLTLMDTSQRNRLPVITHDGHPLAVIHRSMIDRFLSEVSVRGQQLGAIQKLTLSSLYKEKPAMKKFFENNSFATVARAAMLSEAKSSMENLSDCLDVLVTETGSRTEPVIGWITNVMISEKAKI